MKGGYLINDHRMIAQVRFRSLCWVCGILFASLFAALSATPLRAQSFCAADNLSPQERIGINVAREAGKEITDYAVEQLGVGWYLDYTWHTKPARPGGMHYFPMVRTWIDTTQLAETLGPAVDANPGLTWILGNEPDNPHQDRRTPDQYAIFYHKLYHFIKERDPSSRIAIGAITAVTPLRLRYLDAVLASYQARYGTVMPVDVWTVHIYQLPEVEPGGIGIPPGLEAHQAEAKHYTIADHDSLEGFVAQVISFRQWMAARGYRNHTLIISEYGILLPPAYGFNEDRVRNFLLGSFAYLQTARDEAIGLPVDDNRLVQRWGWFSLNFYAFNPTGSKAELAGLNGNLFDHSSGIITGLGVTFSQYMTRLRTQTVDLAIQSAPLAEPHYTSMVIVNRGNTLSPGFRLGLWWGRERLGVLTIRKPLKPDCANQVQLPLTWQGALVNSIQRLRIQVLPLPEQIEYDYANNWR